MYEKAFLDSKKSLVLPSDKKIVSFTFDDCPESAFVNGARILESYGLRGTFYTSMRFEGDQLDGRMLFTAKQLHQIYNKGHEVGCHTYDHINCFNSSEVSIRNNCQKNQKRIKDLIGAPCKSFSYPYGDFDLSAKRLIGEMYRCARTVKPGLNCSQIDLNALKSVPIFEIIGEKNIFKWIDKLDAIGGWLIFYTHDIENNPSQYGCSVELFQKTVAECSKRGYLIMPVKKVIESSFQEASF
jgi:peptidoglycan/xylan/chitin deacetylase (PgdA/CDA1 family)